MKLDIYNNKVIGRSLSDEDLSFLKESGKIFSFDFQEKKWTVQYLFDLRDNSFPVGFIDEIKKTRKDLKITDHREEPYSHVVYPDLGDELPPLRKRQETALEAMETNNTGIIAKIMGSGKSRIIYEDIIKKGVNTLIIVPNTDIQEQLYEMFEEKVGKKNVSTEAPKDDADWYLYEKWDQSAKKKEPTDGITYDAPVRKSNDFTITYGEEKKYDKKAPPWEKIKLKKYISTKKSIVKKIAPITILCYQSLKTTSKWYLEEHVEYVSVDECHHSSSYSIRKALLLMKNAYYRYFFSATPHRDEKDQMMFLISAIGKKVICEYRGKEAIDDEIIAKPKLIVVDPGTPDTYLKKLNPKYWRILLTKGILENKVRNEAIVARAEHYYLNGHNVFIACDEIAHLERLRDMLAELKVPAEVIHGQLNKKEKRAAKDKVAKSKKEIVSLGTMAVGEGSDMPQIDVVILAAGGKSSIRVLQRIGRGIRRTSSELIVIDFKDWYHPTLYKHFLKRVKAFYNEFEDPSELKIGN
jgi:superfamily II DNA or RNA helicase